MGKMSRLTGMLAAVLGAIGINYFTEKEEPRLDFPLKRNPVVTEPTVQPKGRKKASYYRPGSAKKKRKGKK